MTCPCGAVIGPDDGYWKVDGTYWCGRGRCGPAKWADKERRDKRAAKEARS